MRFDKALETTLLRQGSRNQSLRCWWDTVKADATTEICTRRVKNIKKYESAAALQAGICDFWSTRSSKVKAVMLLKSQFFVARPVQMVLGNPLCNLSLIDEALHIRVQLVTNHRNPSTHHIKIFEACVRRMCLEYYNQYYPVRIGQKDPNIQILEACRTFNDEDKVVRKP